MSRKSIFWFFRYWVLSVFFICGNISASFCRNPTIHLLASGRTLTSTITWAINLNIVTTGGTCGDGNGSMFVTASGGTAPYQFSIDGVNFQAGNLFSGLTAGDYLVVVKDANGLSANANATITDTPNPQINVTFTQASCYNINGTITINATGGTAPLMYSIDNGAAYQPANTFGSLDSAAYIVIAKDVNGCAAIDTIHLTALPTPKVYIGNDTVLCAGNTLHLTAPQQPDYTYLWDDNSTGYTYNVTQSGAYSVKVTNQYGCYVSTSINVIFRPTALFSLGNDTTLCNGRQLQLQPTPSLPGIYTWNNGSSAQSLSIHLPGIYWLKISDDGCIKRDSILVNYKMNPQVNLGNDTALCTGQTLLLDATTNNAVYTWQDGSTNPTFAVSSAGTYSVKVTDKGCDTSVQVAAIYITKPTTDRIKDTTICITQELILDAGYPGSTYLWQDGSVQSRFTVTKAGTYAVQVTDNCGTTNASATIAFENCACRFSVPNAFTPNADGRNDIFLPKYQCLLGNYELKVFNRWGQLLFNSRNAGNGWDGSYAGQQQPMGTYVWDLSYKDILTGKTKHQNGSIILIR
jgi:gliding motility-associated-like protein